MKKDKIGGTLFFDAEVCFYPEVTKLAMEYGVDEKKFIQGKFGPRIEASMRYISHLSYQQNHNKIVNLSVLDGKGRLAGNANEKQMLLKFIKVWNKSDEAVAWYGEKFDKRFLNSRIEKYKLPMLKPIKFIDPWKLVSRHFLLPDNKLSTAIKYFKCLYGKPELAWKVWQRSSLGDKQSLKLLRHRCNYDVKSMAWLCYNHLFKYANRNNNAIKYTGRDVNQNKISKQIYNARCPKCEVKSQLKREGYSNTKTSSNVQVSCKACFSWSHAPIKKDGSIGIIR